MSPNGVSNFMHELLEAAQAKEQLPLIQKELEATQANLNEALDRVQRLELRLMDAHNEVSAAHAATRDAEAQRDSAEALFLECDDKRLALHRWIENMVSGANLLVHVSASAPTESSPVAMAEPEPVPAGPVSVEISGTPNVDSQTVVEPLPADPTTSTSANEPSTTTSADGVGSGGAPLADAGSADKGVPAAGLLYDAPVGEGVSVPSDPTGSALNTVDVERDAISQLDASAQSADGNDHGVRVPSDPSQTPASFVPLPPMPPEQPYLGKLYDLWPTYVPLSEWLEGGGTDESYHWRRGNPAPAGFNF